jgi:methionyl-tRNA synthetase
MSTFYVSTSIPYVNSSPHVGFALELVQADALARHRRLLGDEVWFQTGTDDNSLKNVRAAAFAGVATGDLVASNSARFERLASVLDVVPDTFVRTSSDRRHEPTVRALWNACLANGDLYRKSYSGLYCVGCEQFYDDEELTAGCCPEHGTVPEAISEENWFFRLSRYERPLLDLIESGRLEIVPDHRRNEVLSLLRSGLHDISVSRSAARAGGWGIPVPDHSEDVVYVWFDALANYLSGLSFEGDRDGFERRWTEAKTRCHLIGKGISKFHAIYWPAILLSAGVEPPTRILVHGYLTVAGRKIGKSFGNGIDPEPIVADYGTPDALRYYLLRHIRPFDDGDFSESRLQTAWNGELADQIGNLASRVLALIDRECGGVVPSLCPNEFTVATDQLVGAVLLAWDRHEFHSALSLILAHAAAANARLVQRAPWTDAKRLRDKPGEGSVDISQRIEDSLAEQVHALCMIGRLLLPFLPYSSESLLAKFGHEVPRLYGDELVSDGRRIAPGGVLFPKKQSAAAA